MSNTAPTGLSREVRRARLAVSAFFFTNGLMIATLVPHFPGIKAELGLSNTLYGVAIAAIPTGAIIAGPFAGAVIRKLGSAGTGLLFTIIAACALITVPLANHVGALMGIFLILGASDAITDVGQNAHGLRVQRAYGRSIINTFHAIWSIGAVTGGALAGASIALNIPRTTHIAAAATLVVITFLWAYTKRLPGNDTTATTTNHTPTEPQPATQQLTTHTALILLALVAIGITGALVEDTGSTWTALYLRESLGTTAATASLGYIALIGAQFIGRILGDRAVDAWGLRTVNRIGALLIVTGMTLALAIPSLTTAIIGFALAGYGSATLVPAAMQAADELPGLKPGTGLTIVSWLMRLGFLASPPIVGALADGFSLRVGLLVLPIAGAVAVVLAHVFPGKQPRTVTEVSP